MIKARNNLPCGHPQKPAPVYDGFSECPKCKEKFPRCIECGSFKIHFSDRNELSCRDCGHSFLPPPFLQNRATPKQVQPTGELLEVEDFHKLLRDRVAFQEFLKNNEDFIEFLIKAVEGARQAGGTAPFRTFQDWLEQYPDSEYWELVANFMTESGRDLNLAGMHEFFETARGKNKQRLSEILTEQVCFKLMLDGPTKPRQRADGRFTNRYPECLRKGIEEALSKYAPQYVWKKNEKSWEIVWEGKPVLPAPRNLLGLGYIHLLLIHSPEPLSVEDFRDQVAPKKQEKRMLDDEGLTPGPEISDPVMDKKYQGDLEENIKKYEEALTSTSLSQDRRVEIEEKLEELEKFKKANLNHQGRPRPFKSARDKEMDRIKKAMDDAIGKLPDDLARHLNNSISISEGRRKYDPEPAVPWRFS